VDLQDLIREFLAGGVGELLYAEIAGTVRAVVFGYRYPPTYSPRGRWDEDALSGLAHDWAMERLIGRGQIQHFLLTNETRAGFRKGLELSFRHFLIGQKQRTVLDNLFQRANTLLENDPRFRLAVDTGRKATRLWGLSSWERAEPFQGPDADLIAAAFRLPNVSVIRYRPDARRLSPVIRDRDLSDFLAGLLTEVQRLLSLTQVTIAYRYRFNLLESAGVSLDEPVAADAEGRELLLSERIAGGREPDEELLVTEAAQAVLRELSPRQRRILREYSRPAATLTSVGQLEGCSKSTVDNELRRVMQILRQNTGGLEEAESVYAQLMAELFPEQRVGNGGA
jgi:DNA-directed RNA polymerase specialized sigma24 family protein